ncbi:MAG TPA: hypothetical protein VHD62_03730 [Opitutaceae bacterium]|nr:hypothetical protein [Opitutaceae bacterium]
MNAGRENNSRRWAASAAGAIVVMAAVFMLLRVPHAPPVVPLPRAETLPPRIELAQRTAENVALSEQTAMHDQRPLFLPTERNTRIAPPTRPEAGKSVLEQDVLKPTFGDALALEWPASTEVAEKPAQAMAAGATPAPLYGFGRVDEPAVAAPPRGALVEVLSASTNESVFTAKLPVEARPPVTGEKGGRPLEFLAAVDAAGLVGSLVVTEHSDAEEVDSYYRNYLAQSFRLGERLPPGFYRVIVGP